MNDAARSEPRWLRITHHAVFPLLIYVLLTQVFRENYPFSHYPMYSKPNSEELHLQFLADADGKPLPVVWHTGITPSKVAKLHANRLKKYHDESKAAQDVLRYLREANDGRPRRALPARVRLMETTIEFKDGRIAESSRVLAEDNREARS